MPTEKKTKRTKRTLSNDEFPLITIISTQLTKRPNKFKWSKERTILSGKLTNGGVVNIYFPNDYTGDFVIEHDLKGKKWVDVIEHKEKLDILQPDVDKSVFKHLPLNGFKDGHFSKMGKNKDLFIELSKEYEKMGIKRVGYEKYPEEYPDELVSEDLILWICPYDKNGTGSGVDYKIFDRYKGLEGYKEPYVTGTTLKPIPGEKIETIKIGEYPIGQYLLERNVVLLSINPFRNVDLSQIESFKDNLFLKLFMEDLAEVIKTYNIKERSVEEFHTRMVVSSFNKNVKSKIKKLSTDIRQSTKHIEEYETELTKLYRLRVEHTEEMEAIHVVGKDAIDLFIKEIDKVKKQKIVDSVELKNGSIFVTFIPATIKTKIHRSVEDGEGRLVEIFIGKLCFEIRGDGSITITCDHPCTSSDGKTAHPHVNHESGKPCFGSGDGSSLIHKLIGTRKFSDAVYMFWMWIRRYVKDDCYVKPWSYYDDRLQRGLPVFDASGKRISINDVKLIKTGEQIKLKPHKDYEANIKKYKTFKPIK